MLRPGVERIKSVGGLHKFMNCPLPILTDSGGFQVMSLSKFNKVHREEGAIFKSHIDGKKFTLSPEESIRIQKELNSDIHASAEYRAHIIKVMAKKAVSSC